MRAFPLFLTLLACASPCQAQTNYTVTTPYDFPIKPGTQAWFDLKGPAERMAACGLPYGVAKAMTTDALIQTCMAYPFYGDVILFKNGINSKDALDRYFNRFYGYVELSMRVDAPTRLLAYYRTHTETVGGTNQFFDHGLSQHLDCLIKRPEYYSRFTDSQKEELAKLCWRQVVSLYRHPKYTQDCMLPIQLGLDLLVNEGIVIHHNGQILDRTMLPLGAIKYAKGGESIGKAEGNWVLDLITLVEPYVK
jgi:hypothetical protein